MISFALMHLAMIPVVYILEFFPFLQPLAEAPLELLLKLAELAR